jgi:hypothetical protein
MRALCEKIITNEFSALEGQSMQAPNNEYFGKTALLPTLHGKESVIAPIFLEQLGIEVRLANIDTDQFGTFAGEIPRTLSQIEAAISKARAAISLSGTPLAIASEGTIGPDPFIPLATSDFETLVFVDAEKDIVIHESYRSPEITVASKVFEPGQPLDEFLQKADFPAHALIVRSEYGQPVQALKGIRDRAVLIQAIEDLSSVSGSVIVESDLRASFSPSRMRNIESCARLLASRIKSQCPSCDAPGWGKVAPLFGLPCADCGSNVKQAVRADRHGCVRCDFTEVFARSLSVADARFCEHCNP